MKKNVALPATCSMEATPSRGVSHRALWSVNVQRPILITHGQVRTETSDARVSVDVGWLQLQRHFAPSLILIEWDILHTIACRDLLDLQIFDPVDVEPVFGRIMLEFTFDGMDDASTFQLPLMVGLA